MANNDGRGNAITVISRVRWWGIPQIRLGFRAVELLPVLMRDLERLSFIHYAHWTIIDKLPYNGPPQPREKLRHPHFLFESTFNGMTEEYVDAFSEVLTARMRDIWGSSYGFPGPLPTGPFKDYIRRHEFPVQHFYSAYPSATTNVVLAALELRAPLERLTEDAAGMDPQQFDVAYREFLTEVQGLL